MELNLRFGGFYYSCHSEIVDSIIGSYFDDDVEEDFYEKIDYQKTYLDYCKLYVKYFFDYIEENERVKLTIKQKNIEMWSPREYNFSTDVIVLKDVSKSTVRNLTTLFNRYLEDSSFKDFIRHKTTMRDGYIPFYNYEEIVNKKELAISLEFIFEFLAKDFNNESEDIHYKIAENLNLSFLKGSEHETNQ